MCRDQVRYPSLEQVRAAVRAAGTGDHVRFCTRCCGWHTEPRIDPPAPTRPAYVDATGTRRRIAALHALGWTAIALAPDFAMPTTTARQRISQWRHATRVTVTTRDLVSRVYELRHATPGPSRHGRLLALRAGCHTPAQWAGLDIDDPATAPHPEPTTTEEQDQVA